MFQSQFLHKPKCAFLNNSFPSWKTSSDNYFNRINILFWILLILNGQSYNLIKLLDRFLQFGGQQERLWTTCVWLEETIDFANNRKLFDRVYILVYICVFFFFFSNRKLREKKTVRWEKKMKKKCKQIINAKIILLISKTQRFIMLSYWEFISNVIKNR